MKKLKISIGHSGVQHSYQIVSVLSRVGFLNKFYTSFYLKPKSLLGKLLKKNPALYQIMLYKRYSDEIEEQKVYILPFFEITEQLIRKVFGNSKYSENAIFWKDRWFDRFVKYNIKRNKPDIYISYPNCSLESFSVVKKYGGKRILDYPTLHHKTIDDILVKEAIETPELEHTLTKLDKSNFARLDKEIELADFIVVPSDFVKNEFIKQGVAKKKIKKIRYGTHFKLSELNEISIYEKGAILKLVFVGQIQQKKGIKYLLDAVKTLIDQGVKIELYLVGKVYNCENFLKKYNAYFNIVPFMNREELRLFLLEMHVFVLPSLVEGSSLSSLEASSCGLAQIVTKNCGAESVNSSNGFEVDIRSSLAFQNAITYLYNNPESLNEMKRASLVNSREFTWENYKKSWLKFINDIE